LFSVLTNRRTFSSDNRAQEPASVTAAHRAPILNQSSLWFGTTIRFTHRFIAELEGQKSYWGNMRSKMGDIYHAIYEAEVRRNRAPLQLLAYSGLSHLFHTWVTSKRRVVFSYYNKQLVFLGFFEKDSSVDSTSYTDIEFLQKYFELSRRPDRWETNQEKVNGAVEQLGLRLARVAEPPQALPWTLTTLIEIINADHVDALLNEFKVLAKTLSSIEGVEPVATALQVHRPMEHAPLSMLQFLRAIGQTVAEIKAIKGASSQQARALYFEQHHVPVESRPALARFLGQLEDRYFSLLAHLQIQIEAELKYSQPRFDHLGLLYAAGIGVFPTLGEFVETRLARWLDQPLSLSAKEQAIKRFARTFVQAGGLKVQLRVLLALTDELVKSKASPNVSSPPKRTGNERVALKSGQRFEPRTLNVPEFRMALSHSYTGENWRTRRFREFLETQRGETLDMLRVKIAMLFDRTPLFFSEHVKAEIELILTAAEKGDDRTKLLLGLIEYLEEYAATSFPFLSQGLEAAVESAPPQERLLHYQYRVARKIKSEISATTWAFFSEVAENSGIPLDVLLLRIHFFLTSERVFKSRWDRLFIAISQINPKSKWFKQFIKVRLEEVLSIRTDSAGKLARHFKELSNLVVKNSQMSNLLTATYRMRNSLKPLQAEEQQWRVFSLAQMYGNYFYVAPKFLVHFVVWVAVKSQVGELLRRIGERTFATKTPADYPTSELLPIGASGVDDIDGPRAFSEIRRGIVEADGGYYGRVSNDVIIGPVNIALDLRIGSLAAVPIAARTISKVVAVLGNNRELFLPAPRAEVRDALKAHLNADAFARIHWVGKPDAIYSERVLNLDAFLDGIGVKNVENTLFLLQGRFFVTEQKWIYYQQKMGVKFWLLSEVLNNILVHQIRTLPVLLDIDRRADLISRQA
jgi:hypothetical protein